MELYKVLSDSSRLKLIAASSVEELSIGELADILGESQPTVSRQVAPLRRLGLLEERRQGTRVLVRLGHGASLDPVVADAVAAGHALGQPDRLLDRIAEVVRRRDAAGREFFAKSGERADDARFPSELPAYIRVLSLVGRAAASPAAGTPTSQVAPSQVADAAIPPCGAEVPPSQVAVPPSQVAVPPSQVADTAIPPCGAEVPPSQVVDTAIPPCGAEVPPSQVADAPRSTAPSTTSSEEAPSQVAEEAPSQVAAPSAPSQVASTEMTAGAVHAADTPRRPPGARAPRSRPAGVAIDLGTGDGRLLEVLAPTYRRVVAVDREPARLARASERMRRRGYEHVELVVGDLAEDSFADELARRGLAEAVFASRVLHHAPQPAEAVRRMASLVADGGCLVLLDYAPHHDERMRAEEADLWLGFTQDELCAFASDAGLTDVRIEAIPSSFCGAGPDAHLPWQVCIARRPQTPITRELAPDAASASPDTNDVQPNRTPIAASPRDGET